MQFLVYCRYLLLTIYLLDKSKQNNKFKKKRRLLKRRVYQIKITIFP